MIARSVYRVLGVGAMTARGLTAGRRGSGHARRRAARAVDRRAPTARAIGLGSGRTTASVFVRLLGARVRDGLPRDRRARLGRDRGARARGRASRSSRSRRTRCSTSRWTARTKSRPTSISSRATAARSCASASSPVASKRQVIVVGADKLVRALGERFALPVEVIPFAVGPVTRAIKAAGLHPRWRMDAGGRAANS